MINKKVKLNFRPDEPTINNGHIYSRKIITNALDDFIVREGGKITLKIDVVEININHVAALCTDYMIDDDDNIIVSIKILDTPHGLVLNDLIVSNKNLRLTTYGICSDFSGKIINQFTLISLFVYNESLTQ